MKEFLLNNWFKLTILMLLFVLVILLSLKKIKSFLIEFGKHIYKYSNTQFIIWIESFINHLSKWELFLNKDKPTSNNLLLEDLTANLSNDENREQINTYLESLRYAVLNDNVTNIALTGGFGSGKSTIINEFIKQNRGFEYLPISLANFNGKDSDEKLIETSIVQQILYFEKKRKIKESSFHRIDFSKPLSKILFSTLIALWLYSIIYLFFDIINKKIIIWKEVNDYSSVVFQIIFISGILMIIYKSFDTIRNIKFSKLTHESIEIVNEKTDKNLSIFNRNIEEIIYFFEKTNTDIVVIEDIDRFSEDIAIKLFSKIRELSILIKQAKDIKQPVKFIYSVKDELILVEKTKFFDIIIPVIPIIDYNNSKNKFFNKLENEFIDKGILDRNFISEISNYVYDMRTVINICNEFKLYHKILKTDNHSNNLFAIIYYKNLFPKDFAKIQKNESRLHKIFNKNSNKLIEDLTKDLNEKVEIQKNEIKSLKESIGKMIFKDVDELRKIYLFEILTQIANKTSNKVIKIESIEIGNNNLISNDNFNKIMESENIMYDEQYSRNNSSNISFKHIENKINSELNYSQREQLIKDFHNNRIAELENEKDVLLSEISHIENLSIYELYNNYKFNVDCFIEDTFSKSRALVNDKNSNDNIKEKAEKEVIPNIGLVKYLIKNDYINEEFIEYMSYFYPGTLSENDNNLKKKIIQNSFTRFDERIDNAESLVNEINEIRFKEDSILIYSVFDYLLINSQNSRSKKLDLFSNQILNFNDKTVHFLKGFIERLSTLQNNEIISNFYVEMTKWDNFWNLVDDNFHNELKRKVLFDLLQLFSDDIGDKTLNGLNKNKKLSKAISNDKALCKDIFERINPDLFIKTLEVLGVKFDSIIYDKKINELLLKIYEQNLYQVNIVNFKLFSEVDTKYEFNEELFLNSNFTFLKSQKETPLFKLLSEKINEYVEKVYLKIEQNKNELPENVLSLIENQSIKIENKIKIIEKGFIGKFDSFQNIEGKEIYEKILEADKIESNWNNILEYYSFESEINTTLINFINIKENYINLSVKEILENKEDLFDSNESPLKFIYQIINSDKILEESFKSILNSSEDLVLNPSEIKIHDRISFLIDKRAILLDEENFEYFKEMDEKLLIMLIENNEEDFIENINDYEIEMSLLQKLLKSKMTTENLKAMLENEEEKIVEISDNGFLTELTEFYINNKIDDYSTEIFHHLLISNISEELKILLFNLDFSTQDDNQTIEGLKKLGGDYIKIIKQEEIEFLNKEPFLKFLENLKLKKIIKRTYEKKNNKLKISYHD